MWSERDALTHENPGFEFSKETASHLSPPLLCIDSWSCQPVRIPSSPSKNGTRSTTALINNVISFSSRFECVSESNYKCFRFVATIKDPLCGKYVVPEVLNYTFIKSNTPRSSFGSRTEVHNTMPSVLLKAGASVTVCSVAILFHPKVIFGTHNPHVRCWSEAGEIFPPNDHDSAVRISERCSSCSAFGNSQLRKRSWYANCFPFPLSLLGADVWGSTLRQYFNRIYRAGAQPNTIKVRLGGGVSGPNLNAGHKGLEFCVPCEM